MFERRAVGQRKGNHRRPGAEWVAAKGSCGIVYVVIDKSPIEYLAIVLLIYQSL
jgi:hypothetical protein